MPKGGRPCWEILDVGCGTSSYFPILEDFGRMSGVESNMEVIKDLRGRGVTNDIFHDDLVTMRLGKQFNCITAFEIMEHVEDDGALLRNLGRIRGDLVRKLTSAGFRIKWVSYYNKLLFPLAVLVRFLKKTWLGNVLPVSDFSLGSGIVALALENIFALERYWLTRFSFPFGFSIIFVAVNNKQDSIYV